jgi:hypothetical protein
MKLLIPTFFSLLLGFAGSSYGQNIETINLEGVIYVGEVKDGLPNGQGSSRLW